jgi:hypothetical protein
MLAFILLGVLPLQNYPKVGYFITYLITFGTFTPGIITASWLSSNYTTSNERATVLGLYYMLINLAGIISSAVFREQDAPVYKPALINVATF